VVTTQTECYANGVKYQRVLNMNGATITGTAMVERGSTMCYSADISGSLFASAVSFVFRDGSGTQVATGTGNLSSSAISVTCDGGTPTPLSSACSSLVSSSGPCVPGVCVF
jgi:hypothetical protein